MSNEPLFKKLDEALGLIDQAANVLTILKGELSINSALLATSPLPKIEEMGSGTITKEVPNWVRSEEFAKGRKVTYLGSSKSKESKYVDPQTGFIWRHHYSDQESGKQRYHDSNSPRLLRVLNGLPHNSTGILTAKREEYEPGKFAWDWKWSKVQEDTTLPEYAPVD